MLASLNFLARLSLFGLLLGLAAGACWLIFWTGLPGPFTRALPYGAVMAIVSIALAFASLRFGSFFRTIEFSPQLVPAIIACGCLLRLVVAFIGPAEQFSDALAYWNSAVRLVEGGGLSFQHGDFELKSFRPPGVTFLLAGPFWLFGAHSLIPPSINIVCYIVASLALYGLGKRCLYPAGCLLALTLLACHPSQVYQVAMVNAEAPSMAALMVGLYLLSSSRRVTTMLLSGIAFGFTALVKPVYVGLALAALLADWVDAAHKNRRWAHRSRRWLCTSMVVLGMAIAIGPWTARNYAVLDGFALISTNGGSVFYRSNNPMASGTFMERGERDIQALAYDELSFNETGFAWGMEWIKDHPLDFATLAVKKVSILLSDSFVGPDTGFYRFERAWQAPSEIRQAADMIGRVFWLVVWALFLAALFANFRALIEAPHWCLLAIVLFLPVSAHAIFESQMRHLLTVGPIIFLFVGAALGGPKPPVMAGDVDREWHDQDGGRKGE